MKRALLFTIAVLAASVSFGQTVFSSNFETWAAGAPTGWKGSKTHSTLTIQKDSLTPFQGNYAVQLIKIHYSANGRSSGSDLPG
jgi:hypothetical protein